MSETEVCDPTITSQTTDTAEVMALAEKAITTLYGLICQGYSLVFTLSGGKDSTTTAVLGLKAIMRAKRNGIAQATHHISSSDTLVENPALSANLYEMHEEIKEFAQKHGLPVEVHMVTPALPTQFVVNILGRGTLPRFLENSRKKPTGVGGGRQCSFDWKKGPQEKLLRKIAAETLLLTGKQPIIVFGTRTAESAIRKANMEKRGERDDAPFETPAGFLAISPISCWTDEEVWELLTEFMTSAPPWQSLPQRRFHRIYLLYSGMAESSCGFQMKENEYKAPCGAGRGGCILCFQVGEKDRSLSNMTKKPAFAYMEPLNRLRNYFMETRHDLSTRELVGRTVSPAGYAPLRQDVYSIHHRHKLLRLFLTLDAAEIERAEDHEAAVFRGELPDTEENRRLAYPQFNLITPQQIIAIDFYWAIHRCSPRAFYALELWHDAHTLGRKTPIPPVKETPREPIMEKRWFKVGAYDEQAPTDGLRSYDAELWNPYIHPERPAFKELNSERVVYYEEEDELTVDPQEASLFLLTFWESMHDFQSYDPIEAARFYLNEGIVKIARGKMGTYHRIAKRAQYFDRLMARLNLTHKELDDHLLSHSISDGEHEQILNALPPTRDVNTTRSKTCSLFDFMPSTP